MCRHQSESHTGLVHPFRLSVTDDTAPDKDVLAPSQNSDAFDSTIYESGEAPGFSITVLWSIL